MLDDAQFKIYCKRNRLSVAAIEYIEEVRANPPARRVGDNAKHNVTGRVPAASIGQTVQIESRTSEAIFVFQSHLFDGVLELWDQPYGSLQLRRDKGERGIHVASYTPDFLVLRETYAAIVECKTQQHVRQLLKDKPKDWAYVEGSLQFVPAFRAAAELGLRHELFVTDDTASRYLSNLEFLYALLFEDPHDDADRYLSRVLRKLSEKPLTICELCNSIPTLEPAQIYRWLARRKLHGAFKAQLVSQEDVFRLFLSHADATSFEEQALEALRVTPKMQNGALTAIQNATPKEIAHARGLWDRFNEVVDRARKPTRNEYRYMRRYRKVQTENGYLLSVFLPRYSDRGNRRPRLTQAQEDIISEYVTLRKNTGHPLTDVGLTSMINGACEVRGVPTVSSESVRLRFLNKVSKEDAAEGLLGRRGYHNALRPVSAKRATLRSEVAGLLAHVDSTAFDARVRRLFQFVDLLERPTIYVIYDEACNRALGAWLGFGSSDRFALAMAVRDAASRQGRLPAYFFSDRGSEYQSIWWETLLARERISKYLRPAGAPRFGGLQESSLKQLNAQLAHVLPGSTLPDQRGRAATGSKKSRATARLAFAAAVQLTHYYLFHEWNKTRHGTADGSPDELWEQSRVQYGEVGRPVVLDLSFRISTSVPVQVTVGKRKGLRVGYREYWHDDLNALRKPLCVEAARLDPGTPTLLYVKVKNQWFVTEARDHSAVEILPPDGRFLEHSRVRKNAAATRRDGAARESRMAKRIAELEASAAAQGAPAVPPPPIPDPSDEPEVEDVNLHEVDDIPNLSADE